ncbi:MAG: hypothetical protein HY749_21555 [Gammaproteobacteria bacterium]|nr:hypothetical protein [Gammaproteobacteria bacterium]MBI5618877.1 hypothetical protein [Gammaproteobacteria bacterium]
MTIDGGRRWLLALGLSACVAAAQAESAAPGAAPAKPAAAEEPVKFSEAENLLWMTDQLRSVRAPMVIKYAFEKTGSYEDGFKDSVEFRVKELKADGTKSATLNFFSGERHFPVPDSDSTTVNPVLGVFFQGDVYEMNRLTDDKGGARERWRYFQRRIKFALAEAATVKPVTVEFEGRKIQAKEVVIQPYTKDPHRELFKRFADKTYTVTVADELPGYLYRIQTLVPGEKPDAPPLIQETLQLVSAEPDSGKTAKN